MADRPPGDRSPDPALDGNAEGDGTAGGTGGSPPDAEAGADPGPDSPSDPDPDPATGPGPGGSRPGRDEESLVALAGPLATFHVTALVVVALLALHASGRVGAALGGLDTTTGVAAYLLLWGLTYATVRGWLAGIDAAGEAGPGGVLLRAAGWGAATGASFLWIALAAFLVARVPLGEVGSVSLQFVGLFLAVGFGIGGGIAALVGGAVGVAFGAVDYALLGLATRVVARRDSVE